jgi:hypothetical protein
MQTLMQLFKLYYIFRNHCMQFLTMIEVFKTNIETTNDANNIVAMLLQHFPGSRINFDLQDCDKILRVEGKDFCSDKIMDLLSNNGFHCEVLN